MTRVARLLATAAALVLTIAASGVPVARAADESTTTAVVVIHAGDSVRAVTVDVGSGMSGLAVLQRVASVATYGFSGQGGAVCSIDGFGNEATQSACLVGPNSQYWVYFHSSGGATAWTYSPVGAGSYTVHGGDVEGWRYGTGLKPGASPTFCDYVTCPSPPTPTTPAGGSGSTGGTPAAGGGETAMSGGSASGATTPGSSAQTTTPTDVPAADGTSGATTTTAVPASGRGDKTNANGSGNRVRVEAAAASGSGGDGGPGSPVGVAIVGGLLALGAGSAIWLRRRARAPG